ncbi:MAG TPA: hypothetical protein PK252_08170 [Bacteroidales bacterium]|nr:hypothetical protein [Bacteroidales bacterium]
MNNISKILFAVILFVVPAFLSAQELDWEKMLIQDVENINPVYKPVIGFGTGYINYMGDIRNNGSSIFAGSLAFKVNMHAYIDAQRHYKFNFYTLFTVPGNSKTSMTVIQRDYTDPSKNFRFTSDLLTFGLNAHYDFDHFISQKSLFRPFVSLGAELVMFSSKANLMNGNNMFYYWSDGTIRDKIQSAEQISTIVKPDDEYETDMRSNTEINKGEKYNQYSIAVPLEIGVQFDVTNRTSIRLGYAFHLNFTDNMDNVSSSNPIQSTLYNLNIKDNGSAFDNFGYSYVSLHFDLFSDPKMLRNKLLFLDLEGYDYDLIGDEDGDNVFDINDKCLHTPKGLAVDTAGCPEDTDKDGVPDFMDKQNDSPVGAIVDKDGVEIPDNLMWDNLGLEALPRDQVEALLAITNNMSAGSGRRVGAMDIPEKFKSLDVDGDGYISFDEVLKAIDSFFDFDSELNTSDIYELNDFFFAQ